MECQLQIITTPTADTPGTTLMLRTMNRHYVFGNNSEGTTRAAGEMGARLLKAQDIFLTGRTEWKRMGGLMGVILSLADSTGTAFEDAMEDYKRKTAAGKKVPKPQRPSLNLHGPPNLKHLLATCRRFIFRKGMPLTVREYDDRQATTTAEGEITPTWQDENIRVWSLSVSPQYVNGSEQPACLASRQQKFDSELNDFEELGAVENETAEDKERRYDSIRQLTVDHMFNSNWNLDTLVEKHISEVEMPAAIFVRNPETKQLEKYTGPLPGGQMPLPDVRVLTRKPWPGALVVALPPTAPAPEAVSYIVKSWPVRGKFDPKKAQALGVKPGSDYGALTKGQSVKNAKGEEITPDMVLGPERIGHGFVVLDVPSAEYLDAIVRREEFSSSKVMDGVRAFVWILGPGVSSHPTFHGFTKKLDQVHHIVSSPDDCSNRISLDSVAAQTIRLSHVDNERYRMPFYDNATLPQKSLLSNGPREGKSLSDVIIANRGLKMRLMPNFELFEDQVVPLFNPALVEQDISPEIIELANAAKKSLEQDKEALQSWTKLVARPNTEIITLGTGSALPSKYRNVSATLVRVPGIGNYLLDCGENTLGQLQRVFKPDELRDVLRNLRMIWISHLHADHHLGTTSVINAWYTVVHDRFPATSPPSIPHLSTTSSNYGLAVVSNEGMLKWLDEYSAVEDFGYSRILPFHVNPTPLGSDSGASLVWCTSTVSPTTEGENILKPSDYEAVLGVSDLQAVRVTHCKGALAISLTFPQESCEMETLPLKLSYSGDCRPSYNFARIGRNSTVLIHEATFDDELQGDALAKKHSTTSEALGVGAKMKAKAVVLTHFSQRYQKIPVLETIGDGEEEDDVPMKEVQETDQVGDDEDGEADVPAADTTDTTTANLLPGLSHTSSDNPHPLQSHEQVIKVNAKDMKVAIAFDYMRVRVGDIAQLEYFNQALNTLLVKDEEVDNEAEVEESAKTQEDRGKKNGNGKKVKGVEESREGKRKKFKRNN